MAGLAAGTIIGRDFEIVKALGEGGMGTIYLARQISTGADRALKMMLPSIAANENLRAKFVREAQIGSKIRSDHVVQVIGAGIDEASGAPWMVMELLRGAKTSRATCAGSAGQRPSSGGSSFAS